MMSDAKDVARELSPCARNSMDWRQKTSPVAMWLKNAIADT